LYSNSTKKIRQGGHEKELDSYTALFKWTKDFPQKYFKTGPVPAYVVV
jgi:hypothetical protein